MTAPRPAVHGPAQQVIARGQAFHRCACGAVVFPWHDRCIICTVNAKREPRS